MQDTIRVCDVEKYYGSGDHVTKAADRVSFTVKKGEFTGVMGASGSRKTTLLNMLSTIDTVTAGHILALFRCRKRFRKMNIHDLMDSQKQNEEIPESREKGKRLLLPLSVLFDTEGTDAEKTDTEGIGIEEIREEEEQGNSCTGSDTIVVYAAKNLVRDSLIPEIKYMLSSLVFPLFYVGLVFLCAALAVGFYKTTGYAHGR